MLLASIFDFFGPKTAQNYENSWPIELKFFLGVRNREEFPRKKFKVEKFSEKGRKIEKTAKKKHLFFESRNLRTHWSSEGS